VTTLKGDKKADELLPFEVYLANVAVKCEFNDGGTGRVGFLYDSVKDQLKWARLSVKNHIGTIFKVGQILALSEDDYKKAKVKAMNMSSSSIAETLIAAFGDGK